MYLIFIVASSRINACKIIEYVFMDAISFIITNRRQSWLYKDKFYSYINHTLHIAWLTHKNRMINFIDDARQTYAAFMSLQFIKSYKLLLDPQI